MGQLRQRVGLVHELAQLAAAEELTRGRHHRANVDQAQRCDLLRVADGHALAHHPLHAQQPDANLILDQLAHRLDAAVAQVIDVVRAGRADVDLDDAPDDRDHVLVGQSAGLQAGAQAETAVELVAAYPAQVVAARGEEQVLHEALGVVQRRRVTRAQTLVELEQRVVHTLFRIVGRVGRGVALQRRLDERMVDVHVHVLEEVADLVV